MPAPHTDRDFPNLSWHDCHVWGWAVRAGDPARGDWTSELVLELDYLLEWLCPVAGGPMQFRIAPARLVFHDTYNLVWACDWRMTDVAWVQAHPASIQGIERDLCQGPGAEPTANWYRWRVSFNCPQGGELSFVARGFTQTLLAEPVVWGEQSLPLDMRERLLTAS